MNKFFVNIDETGKITGGTASYNIDIENFKPSIDFLIEVSEEIYNKIDKYIMKNGKFESIE